MFMDPLSLAEFHWDALCGLVVDGFIPRMFLLLPLIVTEMFVLGFVLKKCGNLLFKIRLLTNRIINKRSGYIVFDNSNDIRFMFCCATIFVVIGGVVLWSIVVTSPDRKRVVATPPSTTPFCSTCMNVLHIMSDDMRADWGVYNSSAITPNIDRLASEALLFDRAYCQISVCSPSRQSLMTGLRPDRHKVWNFLDSNPLSTQSIPGYFKSAGYLTLGVGKTFHEDNGAWNADAYWSTEARPYYTYRPNECPHAFFPLTHCIKNESDIHDYSYRTTALEYLSFAAETWRNTSRPFFLMVGFKNPHTPWTVPQRVYDLYDEASLSGLKPSSLDSSIPRIAWSREFIPVTHKGRAFYFDPSTAVPDWVLREQIHGYYAAVSYVDEHIGALIQRLDDEVVTHKTIVLVHSDHGYALGEHGYWEKKANFETTVRVPLLIKVPGRAAGVTSALTELIDIFPTVASLAGLHVPTNIDGMDVSLLFENPHANIKDAVFHQFPACRTWTVHMTRQQCNNIPKEKFDYMGYSVRTDQWRYTLWTRWDKTRLTAQWDKSEWAEELYDQAHMNQKLKNQVSKHPRVASLLRKLLRDHFN